jgi:hypothetical protein
MVKGKSRSLARFLRTRDDMKATEGFFDFAAARTGMRPDEKARGHSAQNDNKEPGGRLKRHPIREEEVEDRRDHNKVGEHNERPAHIVPDHLAFAAHQSTG